MNIRRMKHQYVTIVYGTCKCMVAIIHGTNRPNTWYQSSMAVGPIVHGSGTNDLGPIARGTNSPNTGPTWV